MAFVAVRVCAFSLLAHPLPKQSLHHSRKRCLTMSARPSALISARELVDELAAPSRAPLLLDASWHMPSSNRDAQAEFAEANVAGAARFA